MAFKENNNVNKISLIWIQIKSTKEKRASQNVEDVYDSLSEIIIKFVKIGLIGLFILTRPWKRKTIFFNSTFLWADHLNLSCFHHTSHTPNTQKMVQFQTGLSILRWHSTHLSHHHPLNPLQTMQILSFHHPGFSPIGQFYTLDTSSLYSFPLLRDRVDWEMRDNEFISVWFWMIF